VAGDGLQRPAEVLESQTLLCVDWMGLVWSCGSELLCLEDEGTEKAKQNGIRVANRSLYILITCQCRPRS
jgi:hypothetical protein